VDPTPVLELGTSSATALASQADCVGTPPAPLVVLTWLPSGAGQQRVDVADSDRGFDGGAFASSDLLDPAAATLEWRDARGESRQSWRVLTLTPGGWVPSATATFDGPGCVGVDYQD
jgi:hypothetical protein